MAKSKKTGATRLPTAAALEQEEKPYVELFVAGLLAEYERKMRLGPDGQGWKDNELKRAEVTTITEFLRRLDSAVKGEGPLVEV